MDYTKSYFLYILRCFYLNTNCKEPKESLNTLQLYRLAKIHDVQGIVFTKIQNIEKIKNTDCYNKLRNDFFGMTKASIIMDSDLNTLTSLLNSNGFDHILFKGSSIKNCYPSKELRSMGDIDILVREDDFTKIHSLLINNGFVYQEKSSEKYTKAYSLGFTNFEVHTNLANKNSNIHGADFIGFFRNAFNHSTVLQNNTYVLEPEYHLAFLLYHLERHFEIEGSGIRMFLDLPFFIKGNNIDYNILGEYLSRLNLTDFCTCIFDICNRCFHSDLPILTKNQLDNQIAEFFIEKILTGGTFGKVNKSDAQKLLIIQLRNNYDYSTKLGKIKGFFKWMFPSKAELEKIHLWKTGSPVILLPIVYTKRIFNALHKRNGLFRWIKKNKNINVDYKEAELIHRLGIKR